MKIVIWILSVVLIAGSVQFVSMLLGIDFDIFATSKGARGILLAITLATLLALMAYDRRSAAEYGLVVRDDWRKVALRGHAIGIVFYVCLCIVGVLYGAYHVRTDDLTRTNRCAGISISEADSVEYIKPINNSG